MLPAQRTYFFAFLLLASSVVTGMLSIATTKSLANSSPHASTSPGALEWVIKTPKGSIAPACGCSDIGLWAQTPGGSVPIYASTLDAWGTRIIGRDGVNYGIVAVAPDDTHATPILRQSPEGVKAFARCDP